MREIKNIILLSLCTILLSGCDFIYGVSRTAELTQPNQQSCLIETLAKIPKIKLQQRVGSRQTPGYIYSTEMFIPNSPTLDKPIPLYLRVWLFQSDNLKTRIGLDISSFNRPIPPNTMKEITKLIDTIQIRLSKNCHITPFISYKDYAATSSKR